MSEGSRWGPEGPPLEAYSRVTDADRFRPLHGAMLEIEDCRLSIGDSEL